MLPLYQNYANEPDVTIYELRSEFARLSYFYI